MKKKINLDVKTQRDEFLKRFPMFERGPIARLLGLRGPGSYLIASAFWHYATNKRAEEFCRRNHDRIGVEIYRAICDRLYDKISLCPDVRWT